MANEREQSIARVRQLTLKLFDDWNEENKEELKEALIEHLTLFPDDEEEE